MTKPGYYAENARRKILLERYNAPSFRVSGSIGFIDLVAILPSASRERDCHVIRLEQVKSTEKDVFYFDGRSKDEWKRAFIFRGVHGIDTHFMILFKGRGWKDLLVDRQTPPRVVRSH